jgi:hypothetical protein
MQGRSADFDATIQKSHTAVVSAQVHRDGKVSINLETHAGSVSADRTAAQMRSFEFEVIDRDGSLAPTGMTSPLAPFGGLVQVNRGVRIKNESVLNVIYNQANPWTPVTPTGMLNSVKVDPADGSLTLGP